MSKSSWQADAEAFSASIPVKEPQLWWWAVGEGDGTSINLCYLSMIGAVIVRVAQACIRGSLHAEWFFLVVIRWFQS